VADEFAASRDGDLDLGSSHAARSADSPSRLPAVDERTGPLYPAVIVARRQLRTAKNKGKRTPSRMNAPCVIENRTGRPIADPVRESRLNFE
jgi:hypothetical protein